MAGLPDCKRVIGGSASSAPTAWSHQQGIDPHVIRDVRRETQSGRLGAEDDIMVASDIRAVPDDFAGSIRNR